MDLKFSPKYFSLNLFKVPSAFIACRALFTGSTRVLPLGKMKPKLVARDRGTDQLDLVCVLAQVALSGGLVHDHGVDITGDQGLDGERELLEGLDAAFRAGT